VKSAPSILRFISLIILFCTSQNINAQPAAAPSSIDFRFQFLNQHGLAKTSGDTSIPATIRFRENPPPDLLDRIEQMGVKFIVKDGRKLGTNTVYPVRLSFDMLSQLAQVPEILLVQPSWRPFHVPPLDVSRPEVQADSAWLYKDKLGRTITGKGVLIADFDTGVDFFHPMLFFADGDTVNWIDVNTNGIFDPGVDAIDLNKNGIADANETLNYVELPYSANTLGVYDANLDFLYNDANKNGVRDRGTAAGFAESSPTYGEQWFITLDANGDNRLSVGEKLVGLRTSKIRAILEVNGNIRRRGIDLISANADTGPYGGHGTSVAGIAIGGVAGVHRLAGIAPGAEMIFASIQYASTPRFYTDLPAMMVWAKAEGARIMLCEDGEWVWEYLDGSSNEETMIDQQAAEGIVWVTPAGNLTGGGMQKTMYVNGHDSTTATFSGPFSNQVWPSIRWLGELGDVGISLDINGSGFVGIPGNGSTFTLGGQSIYSYRSVSSRGTSMMTISINPGNAVPYYLKIVNNTVNSKRVEGMLGDDGFGWQGIKQWTAPSENNTVTWPATSDSSIGVGAYASKGAGPVINSYSGRGTRIDGMALVDVAAPGGIVYSIARNVQYTPFSGTSSAGPHVAGAAALLLQADTTLTHPRILQLLRSGAASDAYTGTVPNTTWGYGKLRIVNSLKQIITSVHEEVVFPSSWLLEQNYPNPFNSTTTIHYVLPERSRVKLLVYDLLGQIVGTLVDEEQDAGDLRAVWKANVSSGIYFYRMDATPLQNPSHHFVDVKKFVLIK
jgi:subtilisin family serine protease